jgi:hypothetical protein
MATRKGKTAPATGAQASTKEQGLSAKTNTAITGIRKAIAGFLSDFAAMTVKREKIAPVFMRTYDMYRKDMEAAEVRPTFVDFVRRIDSSVPIDAKEYKKHRVYMACDYMRRIESAPTGGKKGAGGRQNTALRANLGFVGRALATLLPLVTKPEDFWKGLAQEFPKDLGKPQLLKKLQTLVAQSQPLMRLEAIKPQAFKLVSVQGAAEAPAATSAARQRKAG